jgi:hypothetical protein
VPCAAVDDAGHLAGVDAGGGSLRSPAAYAAISGEFDGSDISVTAVVPRGPAARSRRDRGARGPWRIRAAVLLGEQRADRFARR